MCIIFQERLQAEEEERRQEMEGEKMKRAEVYREKKRLEKQVTNPGGA